MGCGSCDGNPVTAEAVTADRIFGFPLGTAGAMAQQVIRMTHTDRATHTRNIHTVRKRHVSTVRSFPHLV